MEQDFSVDVSVRDPSPGEVGGDLLRHHRAVFVGTGVFRGFKFLTGYAMSIVRRSYQLSAGGKEREKEMGLDFHLMIMLRLLETYFA
jgi:hypothetical protein